MIQTDEREARVVALKCPGCGAPLQVGGKVDTFACTYCGSNVQVERSGGIVALSLLGEALKDVQRGTDKTAAELAIRRISEDLVRMEQERLARDRAYTVIYDKWKVKTIAADEEHPLGLLVVTNLAAAVVGWMVFGGVSALVTRLFMHKEAPVPDALLGFTAIGTIIVMVTTSVVVTTKWIAGKRKRVVSVREERAAALEHPTKLCEEIRTHIATAQSRLQRNRELVDS